MKTSLQLPALRAFTLIALHFAPGFMPRAFAQGPLTPPGAPAPTMKTLAQIEPRRDLAGLPGDATASRVISAPGSYYLTGELVAEAGKTGIRVDVSHVTIDLNGFRLVAGSSGPIGIQLNNGPSGVAVVNGSLFGWGSAIASTNGAARGVRLLDLAIVGGRNGVELYDASSATATRVSVTGGGGPGIALGASATVASQCTVVSFASSGGEVVGISAAVVSQCAVDSLVNTDGAATGINGGEVSDCTVTTVRALLEGAAKGITAHSVPRCRVAGVEALGPGETATGISGTSVSDCTSTNIAAGTSGFVTGIGGSTIHNSTVANVGTIGSTPSGAKGIVGDTVSNCSARLVSGVSQASGITAVRVADSAVGGISASGSSSIGIGGYRLATGCTVTTVSGIGASFSAGFVCPDGGETRTCEARDTGAYGIHHSGGGVVRGCTVSALSSGTGIFSSSRAVFEDNFVNGCANGLAGAPGAASLVVRNRVIQITGTKFNFTNSQVGPIVNVEGTITSTSPWANFTD